MKSLVTGVCNPLKGGKLQNKNTYIQFKVGMYNLTPALGINKYKFVDNSSDYEKKIFSCYLLKGGKLSKKGM